MNKREAGLRVGAAAQLSPGHTHFANINVAKDVWWLDIPLAKVIGDDLRDLDLLLFDDRSDELHHLRVPTAHFKANMDRLGVRDKKQFVRLELKTDEPMSFQNVVPVDSGVQFAQFLMRTV